MREGVAIKTIEDRVYHVIRQQLRSRMLEPGQRLNLDRLARELHVSNTPIRRAVARLESEGLVVRARRRGYAASPLLDARTISELYDYRLLVEPPAAARAARHPHESLLVGLDELTELTDVAAQVADPARAADIRERDFRFHLLIANAAGNRVVCEHLTSALSSMVPFTLYGQEQAVVAAWSEHRAISEAIRQADPELAGRAMSTHLRNSLTRLQDAIRVIP